MRSQSTPSIVLLPLDRGVLEARLKSDEFCLIRDIAGEPVSLHFGPEFPGDALVLYPRFRVAAVESGRVEGTFIVVDTLAQEVVGQLGTIGPPAGDRVEIGYGINASARGRGIATAAVALLVAELQARAEVGTVVARTAVTNPASGRVLEKNSFVVTGRETSDEGELLVWVYQPPVS